MVVLRNRSQRNRFVYLLFFNWWLTFFVFSTHSASLQCCNNSQRHTFVRVQQLRQSVLLLLWLNDASEVTASDRVQLADGGPTLTIINVTRYDQGPFICDVFNNFSNYTSGPVKLSISCELHIQSLMLQHLHANARKTFKSGAWFIIITTIMSGVVLSKWPFIVLLAVW